MAHSLEHAKEAIEHAGHEAGHGAGQGDGLGPNFGRNVAMLVAMLAATLSLAEIAEKKAQNAYLAAHITASDDWAFYQAKNIRANMYSLHAELLEALPSDAADMPARKEKIDAARAESKRLDDDEKANGRRQLAAKAKASERLREHAFHQYHMFEYAVGALQIAIVLASGSIVARVRPLAWLAGALGIGAGAACLLVSFSAI